MAKKNDPQGAVEGVEDASNILPLAAKEEEPLCGGSFTRNEDGSLTQTEGHGFAQDAK